MKTYEWMSADTDQAPSFLQTLIPMGPQPCLAPHLDMLAILLLCLIFTLLVEQPLLLALDEGLKVSPVAIEPLAVQMNDVCGYGIQEVAVVGDNQNCRGPCLEGWGGSQDGRPSLGGQSTSNTPPPPPPHWCLRGRSSLDLLQHL